MPNDRVDAAAKTISADFPYYQRSPATQLVPPNNSRPIDFPDIPILKCALFRVGIIPGNLLRYIYQRVYVVIIWLGELVGSYEEERLRIYRGWRDFLKLYEEGNDKYGIILSKRAKQDAHSDIGERGTIWLKEVSPDSRVRIRRPSLADMLQHHMTLAMIEARFTLHYGKELPTDWNWDHISMLLSKPWFERVWAIQETFAGSRVTSRLIQCDLNPSIHHDTGESDEAVIKAVPVGLTSTVFIHALRIIKANKKPIRLAPLLLITSRYQSNKTPGIK